MSTGTELSLIAKIGKDVESLADKTKRLENTLSTLLGKLAWYLWVSKTSARVDQKALQETIRKFKRLHYDAGLLSEALLRQLFLLDNIMGEDNIRTARREQVVRIKDHMKISDALMNKAKRMHFLLHEASKLVVETGSTKMEQSVDTREEQAPTATPAMQVPACKSSEDETEDDSEVEELQETNTTERPKETNTTSAPSTDDSCKPGLPRWRPQFEKRRTAGGIALVADMGGVDRSSLKVTPNAAGHSITIQGVKPFHRLDNFFANHSPYGWFEEEFFLPKEYSMKVKAHLDGNYLVVNIPKAARTPPRTPPSTYRSNMFRRSSRPYGSPFGYPFGDTGIFGF